MATIIGTGLEGYIKRNAREKALNRIAEAQSQAIKIREQAEQRVALIKKESQAQAARTTLRNQRRMAAQAQMRAQQALVSRRETMMDQVWESARARVMGIDAPESRRTLIRNLVEDAARQLGGGALELAVNAQDMALLDAYTLDEMRSVLARDHGVTQLTLSSKPVSILGGVIAHRLDAHELVDNSLDERLRLAQISLLDAVYEILTSGQAPDMFARDALPLQGENGGQA